MFSTPEYAMRCTAMFPILHKYISSLLFFFIQRAISLSFYQRNIATLGPGDGGLHVIKIIVAISRLLESKGPVRWQEGSAY
jgi:hypothetical protein